MILLHPQPSATKTKKEPNQNRLSSLKSLVEGRGIEPPKAEPTDLQFAIAYNNIITITYKTMIANIVPYSAPYMQPFLQLQSK